MDTIVCENPNILEGQLSFEQRAEELAIIDEREKRKAEERRKSPFSQFYQVNKEHSEDLMWLVKVNPTAYRLLLFLFDHMDKYNAVMCSYQVFKEALEISDSTVKRTIKLLKDHGFIHIYKSGTSNVYVTNPDLVWNSWGKNTAYCEFPANIILSASEQEDKQKARQMKPKKINVVNTPTK